MKTFTLTTALVSVGTESHAVMVVQQLTSLLAKGGFRLTIKLFWQKFQSLNAPSPYRNDLNSTSNDHVLEIKWNFKADVFIFSINLPKSTLSRRGILCMISSIFDPLRFIAPVTSFKLLFQKLCGESFSWDDPISELQRTR